MLRYAIPLALCLSACRCNEDPEDTEAPEGDTDADTDADTDTDTDTDTDADTDCTATVVATTPEDGAADWYYRDALGVEFSEPAADLATFALTDEGGAEVETEISWSSGDTVAALAPLAPLAGSSAFALSVEVCGAQTVAAFSTSAYGGDLEVTAADLAHRTYVLDFENVVFTDPDGLELILAMFGVRPLLIGVAAADETLLTLYVAEGKKGVDGAYRLWTPDGRSWWFDPADFTTQPFFSAHQELLSLAYDEVEIPISDFRMEGTFAPDGGSIGGLTVEGLADTRQLSDDMAGDENYVCEMMADWGIDCLPCDDGVELCIHLLAEGVTAPLEPDLDIIPTSGP